MINKTKMKIYNETSNYKNNKNQYSDEEGIENANTFDTPGSTSKTTIDPYPSDATASTYCGLDESSFLSSDASVVSLGSKTAEEGALEASEAVILPMIVSKTEVTSPVTKKRRNKRRGKKKKNVKGSSQPLTPSKRLEAGEYLTEEQKASFVALDCEMVGTGYKGRTSALARVSIVDFDGDVVLDTFVKVDEPITNYRTFVSGIEAGMLEGDNVMSLEDCRSRVADILSGKILVGHGLKGDLQALQLTHPWEDTRDSTKHIPFQRHSDYWGKMVPRKLKDLVKNKINLVIQEDGVPHCSIEDAQASMALYRHSFVNWEKAMMYKISKTFAIQHDDYETEFSDVCVY